MKRYACRFCSDYSAEYADISFGGIGAEEGWTTILIRSNLGRGIFADAVGQTLETIPYKGKHDMATCAQNKVEAASERKRQLARDNRGKIPA